MIRQLFTVSTMIMALGMTPTQAYGGTRIQETNQSKNGDSARVPLLTQQVNQ